MSLLGGPEALAAKLDEMLSLPPRFNICGYGQEIHEITEMAVADFGQYAHSNQPVHHVLFLYETAGRLDRLQFETRRILEEYYTATLLPGDEDNGEMCAWYVFAALGFYPACPGRAEYTLCSPLFNATIKLPNGETMVVRRSGSDRLVKSVSLNDVALETKIQHADLARGGTLAFELIE